MPTGGIPGAPPLYLTDQSEAERQAMEMAMGKVAQTHSNLGKVNLKIIHAIGLKPTGTGHSEMIEKLKAFKSSIDELTKKYEKSYKPKGSPTRPKRLHQKV